MWEENLGTQAGVYLTESVSLIWGHLIEVWLYLQRLPESHTTFLKDKYLLSEWSHQSDQYTGEMKVVSSSLGY